MTLPTTAQQIFSTLAPDGTLTVEVRDVPVPQPKGSKVLVKMVAAPINPSDLAGLFSLADLENAQYSPGKVVATMPDAMVKASAARIGVDVPVGIEGAGTVVAAGDDAAAQALMGKDVACVTLHSYSQYCLVDAAMCIPLPAGTDLEMAAASYVNPMTALGFVETLRHEGFGAMVHTAAASNLGQMLVRICKEDSIPLVNVVRSAEQEKILRDLGAEHVVDSSKDSFTADLAAAIKATDAMMAFDPIGGGMIVGQILQAMEQVALTSGPQGRYGSARMKKLYSYGILDMRPITIPRNIGFSWSVEGWLLQPWLEKLGPDVAARMQQRVVDGLSTTFASHYSQRVDLAGALTRDAALTYNARRTGEKCLIRPNG